MKAGRVVVSESVCESLFESGSRELDGRPVGHGGGLPVTKGAEAANPDDWIEANLPWWVARKTDADVFIGMLYVDAGLKVFEGHFPGNPICRACCRSTGDYRCPGSLRDRAGNRVHGYVADKVQSTRCAGRVAALAVDPDGVRRQLRLSKQRGRVYRRPAALPWMISTALSYPTIGTTDR